MTDTAPDHAGIIPVPPPLLYIVPLLLGLGLHRVRPIPFLPRTVARLLGWPLVIVGVTTNAWFILTMRRAHTPINPTKPASQLVTTGPFRYSRNPGYLGLAVTYLGMTAVVNSLWPLLWLPLVLGVVQRGVVEREERYLERKFGDGYRSYRTLVRRWL